MKLKDIFIITQGTRKILAITLSVTLLAIVFAFFYYRSINRSEDPRIAAARRLLAEYGQVTGGVNSRESFRLLDSAFAIFGSLPDYANSFEKGVIYNNKCSAFLLNAIYAGETDGGEKGSLLDLAMKYCDSSIIVYKQWLSKWEHLSAEAIAGELRHFMNENDPAFRGHDFSRIFRRRVEDIIAAQYETPRRLSVSYTNKATIYRHLHEPDSALEYNRIALTLWKDNRTAKSNLSVLMGGEPVKPKLIESLFPPERKKK